MSRLPLIYTGAARRDLIRIAAEIEEQAGRRVASRWIDSFEHRILILRDTPLIGQADEGLGGRRRLVAAPYLIVYELRADAVRIVRIVHGARDLPGLFGDRND